MWGHGWVTPLLGYDHDTYDHFHTNRYTQYIHVMIIANNLPVLAPVTMAVFPIRQRQLPFRLILNFKYIFRAINMTIIQLNMSTRRDIIVQSRQGDKVNCCPPKKTKFKLQFNVCSLTMKQ